MKPRYLFFQIFLGLLMGFSSPAMGSDQLGMFEKGRDLFLAHFDSKTDVDDIHSVAGIATLLADPRFDGIDYHAVAGAYGIQQGLYVPANELFEMAFGSHWSDRHTDPAKALQEVATLALATLQAGGRIWIAEAGQSDFSAELLRHLQKQLPDTELKPRFNIVQHGAWNEEMTTPEDLAFVRREATYHRIPDGNGGGNGTPSFRHEETVNWRQHVTDSRLIAIWEKALVIADRDNGAEGRYLNKTIKGGGLDFSDVVEATWIFGFNDLTDANSFLANFSSAQLDPTN